MGPGWEVYICAATPVFFKPGHRLGASLIMSKLLSVAEFWVRLVTFAARAATAVLLVQIFFLRRGGSSMPDALFWDGNRDVSSL